MEEIETKIEKVKIEGDEQLKRSVKNLRDRNANKPDSESYEDIFNTLFLDKKLTVQLRKYVQNELKKPNLKNNVIAIRHRNIAVEDFTNGYFEDALKHFNTCLCFASFSPEELSRTYCYRGAVYNGLGLYEFCLKDLNRAELLGYPTKTKHILDYNYSCCYYKLKKFESALQYASKDYAFQDPLSEHEEYIKLRFQNLKSMAKARIKEQDENKVEAEQETADKMINLNIENRPNATESESLKMEEGDLLNENNRNINTEENENVDIDFTGVMEDRRPPVHGMARENLEQNPYRMFLEILDAEDSNKSFDYSAFTLNAASSYSFCQDSNPGREFSDEVEVRYDQETGFRLKAKNTLTPGTIITADEPYVANVNPDIRRYYCCYCFQRADIMMLPCNFCSEVRFCSVKCHIKGWTKFHYVDCGFSGFLLRTDPTVYLCMRILLKIGVQKVTRLKPLEPVGLKDHNPNLNDPEEYYSFLYNLPFKNSSASNKTEAALGAVIMLLFLEKMYTKISKVENGCLGAEAINPYDSIAMKTFTQREKEFLGLRIVKHWLQLDVESLKVRNKRLYITYLDDEINGSNYEHSADYVLPLLNLFDHSCDPNVYSVRFEGGPEIFRVARTISPGEFLTVAKGADIYRHDFGVRYGLLRKDCACEACELELKMFGSKLPIVKELVNKLKQAEEFYIEDQYENGLELVLDLIKLEHQEAWLFWRLQRYIIETLHEYHFVPKNEARLSEPKFVIEVLKAAILAMKNLDFSHVSLFAFVPFGRELLEYVKMVRELSAAAPSVLDTPNGQEMLSELFQVLQHFQKKFLNFSMKTHHERCISSMLRSEERSLDALIKKNMSS